MNRYTVLKKGIFAGICACLAAPVYAQDQLKLNDLTQGDPFFYTEDQNIPEDHGQSELLGTGRPDRTHSQIPHLPVYYGYMSTNYTYRFVNIMEQVFTMIGEGKHCVWRAHESGYVREYLRPGKKPLPKGADLFADKNLERIEENYSHFIPKIGIEGYRYPDQRVNGEGGLTFIDLPITHPKYDDKYSNAKPIQQSLFYCTMSGSGYPYAWKAMRFAFAQPGANEIGPLGKKAGLNIEENFTNVLRLEQFGDANTWVNVGVDGEDELHVKWKAIDQQRTKSEYYIVERPFFNTPYLFLIAVFDNQDNRDFEYARPDGSYYDSVSKQAANLKTEVTRKPRFHLKGGAIHEAEGLPIYGVHHPNRAAFGGGGACPLQGGDWGRYPETSGGSAWPTTYEEVTPLCDAVLVDIKYSTNLDGRSWADEDKYLANAGVGQREVTYRMRPGEYGVFTDAYNTDSGITNPESRTVPAELELTFPAVPDPVGYNPPAGQQENGPDMNPIGTSCRPIPQ